jgi:predicted metal-dependent hydrolase
MPLHIIHTFALSKLNWIRERQRRMQEQARETRRESLEHESHDVWGKRLLLSIIETRSAPSVAVTPSALELRLRPGSSAEKRAQILKAWMQEQVRMALPALLSKWEPVIGVQVKRIAVRRMKTRWGSCSPSAGRICLNSDLAHKPPICLEYVLVHELAHFLEPSHNARFQNLMDRFLPNWRQIRHDLNRLPPQSTANSVRETPQIG